MIPPSTHIKYPRGKNPPPTFNSVGATMPTGERLDCLHQLRYPMRITGSPVISINGLNQTTGATRESIAMDWIGLDWYNYSTGYEYIQQLRCIDNINLDAS